MVIPDLKTFLIVCPLVLLAGFVDSIGGGGGLISLPGYLIAGLPAHQAIATNKMSSTFGTALTTVRFARKGFIKWKQVLPSIFAGLAGSWGGAHLSLLVDSDILEKVLYVILPLTAILVLRRGVLKDTAEPTEMTRKAVIIAAIASLIIGMYDGFYGPGTGTFLIVAFSVFAKMDVLSANGQCKAVNLTTNVTSLIVFLRSGQVMIILGIAAAACNMIGNWIGSGLALKAGTKITRPIIILVLILLFLKVIGVLDFS